MLTLLHSQKADSQTLLEKLQHLYIPQSSEQPPRPYTGEPNSALHSPISRAEVYAAITKLNTPFAPGPDGITNRVIANFDDSSIAALTDYMNRVWDRGKLPSAWKHALVTLIPKLKLENLRPISLTSCLGKLLEHVVLSRLHQHMEERQLFPHTMVGFRPGLSTQDVTLQLQHEIIDNPEASPLDAGLDLTKAFDCVSHAAILNNLNDLHVGVKTYTYIADFLPQRTTQLNIQGLKSDSISLGSRGAPQGSVLSPFLFNVAMLGLPPLLDQIPNIRHSLYADDITVWTVGGSDAEIQERLQAAADVVHTYVHDRGLACSPQKSEILLYNPTRPGRRPSYAPDIQVFLQGNAIPKTDCIRTLGLRIHEKGTNTATIQALHNAAAQITRLITRIANKHHGPQGAQPPPPRADLYHQ